MSEFLDTPELQDKVIVRLVDDDKDFLRSMKLMLERWAGRFEIFLLLRISYKKKTSRFPDASC